MILGMGAAGCNCPLSAGGQIHNMDCPNHPANIQRSISAHEYKAEIVRLLVARLSGAFGEATIVDQEQMLRLLDQLIAERYEWKRDAQKLVEAVSNVVEAWENLCACVDEFGKQSAAYGEREEILDTYIIKLREALVLAVLGRPDPY